MKQQKFNRLMHFKTYQPKPCPSDEMSVLLQQLNYSLEQFEGEFNEYYDHHKNDVNYTNPSTAHNTIIQNTITSRGRSKSNINPLWLLDSSKRQRLMRDQAKYSSCLPQLIHNLKPKAPLPQRIIKKGRPPIRGSNYAATNLVPKEIRKNPLAKPKVVYESAISREGICNLINRGMIDKHIDIGPAFQNSMTSIDLQLKRISLILIIMMKFIVLTLLIVSTLQVSLKLSPAKKVEELRNSKFGRTLLQLMSLHSQVQGPLEELIEAIEELVNDIDENLEELNFNYQIRTNQHNSYVVAVEQELQDAQQDVARMEDVIDNLLVPRKVQIEKKIQQINDNMDYNRQTIKENTLQRKQEHEDFELQVQEDNEAIEAVDDALNLLATLSGGSLLQIKTLKHHFKRIPEKSWNRVQQGPLLLALIQLAGKSNFADASIVKEIADALQEFRNQVVDALNDLTKLEGELQIEFEERLVQLDHEFADLQRQIAQANVDLTATLQKLQDCQQFLDQRLADQKQYQGQLDLENDVFVVETEIYTNAKNNLLQELGIAEQGLAVVKSADFSNIKI